MAAVLVPAAVEMAGHLVDVRKKTLAVRHGVCVCVEEVWAEAVVTTLSVGGAGGWVACWD
jgi:hypothetical protein